MDHLAAKPAAGQHHRPISDHQRGRDQQHGNRQRDARPGHVHAADGLKRYWRGYVLNVRQATAADLDAYIELLAHFHESSPMRGVAPYDPDGIRAFLTASLENTNIRFPTSPFLEPTTGRPSREWVIWLQNPQLVSQTVSFQIINGGEINSTIIGNVTPAAGTFTSLTALNGIGGGTY